MKTLKAGFLIVLLAALASIHQPVHACTVCHSKNPGMVKMHKELEGRNCFDCHKMRGKKSSPEEVKARIVSDPLCTACHNK